MNMDRREVLFERIGDVIECQQRQALTAFAFTEWLWHRHSDPVSDSTDSASAGCTRTAA
jgi:hypothetical protein